MSSVFTPIRTYLKVPILSVVWYIFATFLVPCSWGFTHTGIKINLTDEEKAWLAENPVIAIGTDTVSPPYQFTGADGNISGIIADLARALENRLGVEFVFSQQHPSVFIETLRNAAFPILGFLPYTGLDPAWPYLKTLPVVAGYLSLYSTKKRPDSVDPAKLRGAVIAITAGVDNHKVEQLARHNRIVLKASPEETLRALIKGSADYCIEFTELARFHLHKAQQTEVVQVYTWPEPVDGGLLVRRDQPLLHSILNKVLPDIKQRELPAILDKWYQWGVYAPPKIELTGEERAWLKAHPVVRVASDPAWEPIECMNNRGEFQGIAIDYLKKLEAMLGIRFEPAKWFSWQVLVKKVQNRELDMFSCVAKTPERSTYLSFTEPYLTFPIAIFMQNEAAYVSDPAALQDKRVSLVEGYAVHELLQRDFPDLELVPVKTVQEGLTKLNKGLVDAFIGNLFTTSHYIAKLDLFNLKVSGETPYAYQLRFGVRNDWPLFTSILQKSLNALSQQDRDAIKARWFGITYQHTFDYTRIWKVLIPVLLVLLIVLYRNWRYARTTMLQQKKAAERLNESENRYRSFFETARDGAFITAADGRLLDCNQGFVELFGYRDKNELMQVSVGDLYAQPDERSGLIKKIMQNGFIAHLPFDGRKKDGSIMSLLMTSAVMKNEAGAAWGFQGTVTDITQRKKAEEELKLLAAIIEQASEFIVITDNKGTIQYVNPSFCLVTGYGAEEVVGCNPSILKSGRHLPGYYKTLWDTISAGETWRGALVNKKKDGTLYDEEATITPIKNSDGDIINFVAVKRDVTREIKMERQLRQSQKMESIGTLAGGIAHDFNNILAAIMGYTELSLDDVADMPETHSSLQQVLLSTHRARDLIAQIMTFSRSTEIEKKPVKTIPIVREVCKLMRSSLPATIDIRQTIKARHDWIMADPTQVHQLLMNLCTNAGHAMQHGNGVLEVLLQEVSFEKKDTEDRPDLAPGPYLKLTVKDTGRGIGPELLDHIFEPYFTTKQTGEGTGLGLAVVHGIVKDCGGDINVESKAEQGTAFHVLFPRIETSPEATGDMLAPLPRGTESVLFVDDEKTLVDIARRMLKRLGYSVTGLTDASEALGTFKQAPASFDLVITDKTMPKMTGLVLAEKLRKIRPDIPILLCTGYKEKDTEVKLKKAGINGFILKPINKRVIAEKIREILDTKTA